MIGVHENPRAEPKGPSQRTFGVEEDAMQLVRRQFLSFAGAAIATTAISRRAVAQIYPARPVRLIVTAAPSGPADVTGRLIAQKLSEQLEKQFYIENIGGAGGNIGMGRAAQARPDGYTLLVVPPNYAVNHALC